ncbi:plastocyanin/azurin family copper-binding protein [Halosimplex aquaticum]
MVGETVVWVWHSSGHNVRPESTPSGSDFSGTAGGDDRLYDEGHTLSHTFEVAGEYEYYCNPHRSAGMTGSFTVAE